MAQLKLMGRMLPEAVRARLGIERLVENNEKQLKALRTQPSGKSNTSDRRDDRGPEHRKPQVGGWILLGDPEHPLNKKAKEIWKSATE